MTRLRKFEEAGPPIEQPRDQQVKMRLKGGRTGKRAVVCEDLELTGLMKPFDLEVWYGERVAVLGSNGSGKSHFLRLLARGGSDPDKEHQPVETVEIKPVDHTGKAKLGARVRPGWFVQTHEHPELLGRTLLEILHRGDEHRDGMGREAAARVLDRYELAHASEQRFESLSGGQQARFQILLLELSGATLLLLDEPTDNLDVQSAEALEAGLESFEGTVIAVTHDRWFARGFDRFLVYGASGDVYESDGPVWDETPGAAGPLTPCRLGTGRRTVGDGQTGTDLGPDRRAGDRRVARGLLRRLRGALRQRPAGVGDRVRPRPPGGRPWHVRFHPAPNPPFREERTVTDVHRGVELGYHARIQDDDGHERFATQVLVTFEPIGPGLAGPADADGLRGRGDAGRVRGQLAGRAHRGGAPPRGLRAHPASDGLGSGVRAARRRSRAPG